MKPCVSVQTNRRQIVAKNVAKSIKRAEKGLVESGDTSSKIGN